MAILDRHDLVASVY